MARKRKTFSVAQALFDINQKNQLSTCSAEVRQGWNSMIETILMAAEVYTGFGYLRSPDLPTGQKAGIRFTNAMGVELTAEEYYDRLTTDHANQKRGLPTRYTGDQKSYPDESRRTYYVHGHITAEYRAIAKKHEQEHGTIRLPLSAEQAGIDRAA
jgi:hypothetical protein